MIQLSTIGWTLIVITWIMGLAGILGCAFLYKQCRLHSQVGLTIMYHLYRRDRSYTQLLTMLEGCYGCRIADHIADTDTSSNVSSIRYPDDPTSGGAA